MFSIIQVFTKNVCDIQKCACSVVVKRNRLESNDCKDIFVPQRKDAIELVRRFTLIKSIVSLHQYTCTSGTHRAFAHENMLVLTVATLF